MGTKPHIIILGAGPAGLGAARQLVRNNLADVSVIEKCEQVGGIAGSFQHSGLHLDYGSHRLHPACDRHILEDIQCLLGDDLLNRPRHGRIRLGGSWIHFPLKPLDLIRSLPVSFSLGVMHDLVNKFFNFNANPSDENSFASILEGGLGRTICHEFYFPFAQKLWGLPPDDLSANQAYRRVSANALDKMFRKIVYSLPGLKKRGSNCFFYPRKGFGQISEHLYQSAKDAGAVFYLNARLDLMELKGTAVSTVHLTHEGKSISLEPDYLWSTIPVTSLVDYIKPSPPPSVIHASRQIAYRAMILIYLVLEQDNFSEYDAHYFPQLDIPISRLSEPKNYTASQEPHNLTVLCAELPCSPTDPEWHMTDEELGKLVCHCLRSTGIPVLSPAKEIITRRLHNAYPIYQRGYESHADQIDSWLNQMENLLTFGRQGLFVHDNAHHALAMGYAAAGCINGHGKFDRSLWHESRKIFTAHVVED